MNSNTSSICHGLECRRCQRITTMIRALIYIYVTIFSSSFGNFLGNFFSFEYRESLSEVLLHFSTVFGTDVPVSNKLYAVVFNGRSHTVRIGRAVSEPHRLSDQVRRCDGGDGFLLAAPHLSL